MIISRGRKYIFVHIPKTGGTSLALALEARAMKDDMMLGDTPKAVKRRRRLKEVQAAGRLWKHATLSDIEGLVTAEEIDAFFTFTMVRNPWDRLVSYYYWLRMQSFDHAAVRLAKALDFQSFLAHPSTRKSINAAPYSSYMRLKRQEVESCFIRLEHFQEDAQPLFEHLGFALDLPHSNASERQADYRGYYGDDTAKLVADLCAEDIVRFGYSFD